MDKIKTALAGRHFTADVILWAVCCYLQFPGIMAKRMADGDVTLTSA